MIFRTIPQTKEGARRSTTSQRVPERCTRTASIVRRAGRSPGRSRPNERTSTAPWNRDAASCHRSRRCPPNGSKYRYHRFVAARAENPMGTSQRAVKKICGAIPFSARRSADAGRLEVRVNALPRALTPRSVRLATATAASSVVGATPTRRIPSRTIPSTVRSPGCRAHPAKSAPSYPNRTNQRDIHAPEEGDPEESADVRRAGGSFGGAFEKVPEGLEELEVRIRPAAVLEVD